MSHGDACVGRGGEGAGDAGNDFKAQFRRRERLGFFAAASEQEGIAPLEPHHALALAGELHEQGVDHLLVEGVASRLFAGVDDLGFLGSPGEHFGVAEVVVNDRVGGFKDGACAQRHQPKVARARAGEITDAALFFGHGMNLG